MNIPLTQRQLLTAFKHVCDYLKYREPKRMVGDTKTWGPSKAIFCHFKREKRWRGSAPGQAGGDFVMGFVTASLILVFARLSRLAEPHVCLFQQEFGLFSLKLFRRTCNYGLLRQLGNRADAGNTPKLLN